MELIARTFRVCVKGNAKQTVAFAVDFLVFTQAIACLRAHGNPILAALRGKEIAGRLLVRQGNIAAVDDLRPRFGGIALLENQLCGQSAQRRMGRSSGSCLPVFGSLPTTSSVV